MKKLIITITSVALCSVSSIHAGGGHNGFLETAAKYDRQAAEARAAGKHEAARLLERMAEIKRQAAAGRVKSWDEYFQLANQLKNQNSWPKNHSKNHHKQKKGIKKYDQNIFSV